MNKRKSFFILSLVLIIIWSIIATFNYKIAETAQENKFTISSSVNTLKLDDTFSITLIGEFNKPEDAVQGRIEYSDDVEIVGNNYYEYEEFADIANGEGNGYVAQGTNNAIGFAIVRNANSSDSSANTVTGTKKIITFTFKVNSSSEKNVEIKWKGKNKSGLYDITSISIPRSDVEGKAEENKPENKPENNEKEASSEQTSNNGKDSNNEKASNVKETKGKTFIPQTGESYICIIMIIIVIAFAIIFRKKSKKNK